jgi:hypothetical protein
MDGATQTPTVTATILGAGISTTCALEGGRVKLAFPHGVTLREGQTLSLLIG